MAASDTGPTQKTSMATRLSRTIADVRAVVPFAIGPDRELLARLAPGIVWIAAFLSMLLGLDRLFRADEDDQCGAPL